MNNILNKDCLEGMRQLDSDSIDCIITSPPYNKKGLVGKVTINKNFQNERLEKEERKVEAAAKDEKVNKKNDRYKYHEKGNQIWNKFEIDYVSYNDNMPEQYYQQWMTEVLNEMTRIIKPDGSIFFNHKPRRHKNRSLLPTDFISKSEANLYQLIIWDRRSSPNIRADILVPCTEHIYWFCKQKPKVYRNQVDKEYKGEVWNINVKKQQDHPAPFPYQLVKNCILLSTQKNDIILDPFMGGGTTALVAQDLDRRWMGFEVDKEYIEITRSKLRG